MLLLLKIVPLSRVTGYHLTMVLLLTLRATSILQVIYLLTGVFHLADALKDHLVPLKEVNFQRNQTE